MSHIWTGQLDNLRGCKLKGNVALIRSLWWTLSINQQTFTAQRSNSPSYSQALVSVISHWSDFRPPHQTCWFVSDQLLDYTLTSVPLVGVTLCLFLTVALKEQLQTLSEVFPVTCTQPVNAPPSMTVEYLQIGVGAPHLVPVCVNPLPSLQLSLLHCPSCKASLIATLRVMPLHVCAGVPQAGFQETGSVGGGSGGKNSLLPEGDSSPAATVKGTTGCWGETAAV